MQFSSPLFFLLLPLPLLFRLKMMQRGNAVAVPPQLETTLNQAINQQVMPINLHHILLWVGWIGLLAALAQPWRPGDTEVQPVSGRALALAVDVSGSMERRDFTLDGEVNDRLSVVKNVARDFIDNRRGDRLSLVLYGRDAFIASPLTFDLSALGDILVGAGIGMAGRSTAIGDAIGLSIQTLQHDPATSKAIVLLSDGTNNAGSVEPESAAELALSMGIRIHTIALGSQAVERRAYQTEQSADLDEQTLRTIAETANGKFFRASTTDDLIQVYTTIDTLERAEVDAPPVIVRQRLDFWPMCLCLAMLLILAIRQHRSV
jgi:Ca-activated chloride channel family protein